MPESTSGTEDPQTASWTDSVAASGRDALRSIEGGIGTVGRGVWEVFRELPILGALIGGGLGLGAAIAVGVGELAVTLIASYVGYRMLAYGETITEAFEKSIELREGKLLDEEIRESALEE
ncbi:MAG: hypothetical protein HY268_08035 [Deltaproteobacteria bacterium]|nr:hypothetical protein [Deltaproteobacteria bacterium]